MCRRFRRKRAGASVVEFAIVAPLFFLLVLGMVEFGRMVMVQQILTNASREASRRAVLQGTSSSEVEALVRSYLTDASVDGNQASIEILDGDGQGIGELLTSNAAAVSVRVGVSYDDVSWLPVSKFLAGRQLRAMTTMRRETSD